MNGYCFPDGAGNLRLRTRQPLAQQRYLTKHDVLFTASAPFAGPFGLRAGSARTSVAFGSGPTQVIRIDLAGDVLGLEGYGTGIHTTTVVALENSTFCFVPQNRLMCAIREQPALRDDFLGVMARALVNQQRSAYALGSTSAQQRIASFLLTLSGRLAERGYATSDFDLRLTRRQIGSLLGLTLETVSRCLSGFEAREMIRVSGRRIELLDPVALGTLVACVVQPG